MKIVKLNYRELVEDLENNPWELKGLYLDECNLIVGKNSVGKSRTVRIIVALANIIALRAPITDGDWCVEFISDDPDKPTKFVYELKIVHKKVITEKIHIDDDLKLDRNGSTKIYSEKKKEYLEIEPPDDKLVLHIRRDKNEYKFFEYLIEWAMSVRGYEFSDVRPNDITIEKDITTLVRLNTVPQVIEKLDNISIKNIINEFNSIGYDIEEIKVNVMNATPINIRILEIKEKGLKHYIKQIHLSQGMFRALALLIIINYLLTSKETSTILIDDLCEGMDFERATNFTKIVYEKLRNANIQLIATSNDSFLMNVVDIKYWNILKRKNTVVTAYNHVNSKEIFDEFKSTSLNNFDFLTSNYYTKLDLTPDEKN